MTNISTTFKGTTSKFLIATGVLLLLTFGMSQSYSGETPDIYACSNSTVDKDNVEAEKLGLEQIETFTVEEVNEYIRSVGGREMSPAVKFVNVFRRGTDPFVIIALYNELGCTIGMQKISYDTIKKTRTYLNGT